MRRIVLLALACILVFSSCNALPPDTEGEAISVSATESREPETSVPESETAESFETTVPETVETLSPETEPPETEPEETGLEEVMPLLPAHLILEVSERLAEVSTSYTRKTKTVTEIRQDGESARSEILSELLVNNGNAAFRRTSDSGEEEFFLIDGFLCYGGKYGNYRFGGYDIQSFSELAGNYFSLGAFEDGTVEANSECITLKFTKLTEQGFSEISEMLGLTEDYEMNITKAEFIFVADVSAHMKEKKLTLEATVKQDGEEILSFSLSSHTEQSGINEPNDLALPAMTSYVLIPDISAIALYEAALADVSSFFGRYQAFELNESDEINIGGAVERRITENTNYAYAKKIGATFERIFDNGSGKTRVLTHFNRRRAFSQINGGSIFVDSTFNAKNLELTLTAPFDRSMLPFAAFARIEEYTPVRLAFAINQEGKIMLAREALLASGIYAETVSVTSCDDAKAYLSFDSSGNVTSIGFSFSARITADGKTYTVSRNRSLKVTKRGSAQVKVIYIDVDEEEE